MDVARGNQTLFMRSDEVEAAWAFIDPIVHEAKLRQPENTPLVPGVLFPRLS